MAITGRQLFDAFCLIAFTMQKTGRRSISSITLHNQLVPSTNFYCSFVIVLLSLLLIWLFVDSIDTNFKIYFYFIKILFYIYIGLCVYVYVYVYLYSLYSYRIMWISSQKYIRRGHRSRKLLFFYNVVFFRIIFSSVKF